ncbi:MAG: D-glycero-beta-D-manno-heptose 1,7-bisphosphate 7-phosphatase [Arenicellales bacterium]|nr:D-glycero-beta-D-manno-heptose 1,7-bisphosphate 7-phosphatase [Arenicellales bacterium]
MAALESQHFLDNSRKRVNPMRLVILDRDGVINRDSDAYIKSAEEWEALPGSLEAIARLCRAHFRVVIASNQSGLGRGLFNSTALNRIHDKMHRELRHHGGALDAIFLCPHTPEEDCGCRKPAPGLFAEIAGRLKCSLSDVPAVGDSLRDLEAAEAGGAKPIYVLSGKNPFRLRPDETLPAESGWAETPLFENLSCFVDALLDGKLNAYLGRSE